MKHGEVLGGDQEAGGDEEAGGDGTTTEATPLLRD